MRKAHLQDLVPPLDVRLQVLHAKGVYHRTGFFWEPAPARIESPIPGELSFPTDELFQRGGGLVHEYAIGIDNL